MIVILGDATVELIDLCIKVAIGKTIGSSSSAKELGCQECQDAQQHTYQTATDTIASRTMPSEASAACVVRHRVVCM